MQDQKLRCSIMKHLLAQSANTGVLGPHQAGTVGAHKSANRLGQGSSFAHK